MNNARQYVKLFLAQIIINWDGQNFREKMDSLLSGDEIEAIEKLIVHFEESEAINIKNIIDTARRLQEKENE
jgi:hypothetical protein